MTHRFQKTLLVLLTLFLLGFSWLVRFGPTAEAAVTLVSFDVVPGATPLDLDVKWVTETETDVVGFRLKRSTTINQQEATIVANVPKKGTAETGAEYTYTDRNLPNNQTYYYWLYELTSSSGVDLVTPIPESETLGVPNTPTRPADATATPTRPADATATPTRPADATATPTRPADATATPTRPADATATPTRLADATATPTRLADATATFTVSPQATNTPVPVVQGDPTNTSVPLTQAQTTNTPVVSVTTPIVEGATLNPNLPTPEVKTGATVGAILEDRAASTDQTPQVPSTPTQVLDAAAASGTTSDVTPTPETTNSTPQAVAQEAAAGSAPSTERLSRPTATPRPSATAESSSGSGSLLLILGGASLFGAVVLALAALVIWRRR